MDQHKVKASIISRNRLAFSSECSGGRRLHADNTLMPSTLHRTGGGGARRPEGEAIRGGKMGKVRSFALLNTNNFIELEYPSLYGENILNI